jgi:hypothetical protein
MLWNISLIFTLAIGDHTIYTGGEIEHIGGQTRSNIVCLDDQSGRATPWNPPDDIGQVKSLMVSGDAVYAGGAILSAGGQSRKGIVALKTTTGFPTMWDPPLIKISDDQPCVAAQSVNAAGMYIATAYRQILRSHQHWCRYLDFFRNSRRNNQFLRCFH